MGRIGADAALVFCAISAARGQEPMDLSQDPEPPEARALKVYLREQIMANDDRNNRARGGRNKQPLWRGLSPTIPADLPEQEGFVESERMPGSELAIDGSAIERAGFKVSDVFEDEEWVRLPNAAKIRREIRANARPFGRWEVWHYPPGTRIAHRVWLKNPRRVFEIRFSQKLADEKDGSDGPWAFGLYRVVDGSPMLKLYDGAPGGKPEEPIVIVDLPGGGPRRFQLTRISPASCRVCHIDHGEGWYQYHDEDHAGPCGFAPANKSILARWAAAYERRHGYLPFTGP